MIDGYTSAALDRPFNVLAVEPIMREAQQLIAAAGQHVHKDSAEQLSGVGQMISQSLQLLQKMKGQAPMPPEVQAIVQTQMAETQRKMTYDQTDLQLRQQKQADDKAAKEAKIIADEQMKAADISHDINTLTIEKQFEMNQAQQEQIAQQQQAEQQQRSELETAAMAHQMSQQSPQQ